MKRTTFSLFAAVILAAFALTGTLMWAASPVATAPVAQATSPISPDHTDVVTKAVAFMATQVISDGSLSGDPFASIKGVIALAAAGMPQHTLASTTTGKMPLDFLANQAITYTADVSGTLLPGRLGMVAVAATAANADAANFGGMDMISGLHSIYQPATGAYSTTAVAGWTTGVASTINQLWSILGLASVQENIPVTATQFLLDLQETDGGWGYGFGGDVDTTALTIQALLASGNITVSHPAILDAVAFLKETQDANGAWGYVYGGTYYPSADTTASVLQALAALGYSPATTTWAVPGGNPHSALAALQGTDGSFSYNALGTAHAVAGLLEAPLPILGSQQRADLALTWIKSRQFANGAWGFWGQPSTSASLDAILAFATAGYDPDTVAVPFAGLSAMGYLASDAFTYTRDVTGTIHPASAGKLILGVVAADDNPTAFGEYPTGHPAAGSAINLVEELAGTYNAATGAYSSTAVKDAWTNGNASAVNQAWAMLGLAAAGETIPANAITFLNGMQSNNNWGGIDTTAIAMQALVAAGESVTSTNIMSASLYLSEQQDAMGGWGNANSTAYAIQALSAVGENLTSESWLVAGRSPFSALLDYQKPDGPFAYQWAAPSMYWNPSADNDMATWQAVPAMLGVSYPYVGQDLEPFVPVMSGPDADRLVVGELRFDAATQIVELPFGSDWNMDAIAFGQYDTIKGRQHATDVMTFTLQREAGRFFAQLTLTDTAGYGIEVSVMDYDGVQGESHQVHLAVADLSESTKSVTPARATSGDTVTYTISLLNSGPVTATQVLMTDVLPWQVKFDSWVQQNGALTGTHVISWTGDIAPQAQVDIVFTAKVLMPNETLSLLIAGPAINTFTYGSPNTMMGEKSASFDFYIESNIFLPLVMR